MKIIIIKHANKDTGNDDNKKNTYKNSIENDLENNKNITIDQSSDEDEIGRDEPEDNENKSNKDDEDDEDSVNYYRTGECFYVIKVLHMVVTVIIVKLVVRFTFDD